MTLLGQLYFAVAIGFALSMARHPEQLAQHAVRHGWTAARGSAIAVLAALLWPAGVTLAVLEAAAVRR